MGSPAGVALLGGETDAGRALAALDLGDIRLACFADEEDPALLELLRGGARLVDLRTGPRGASSRLPPPTLFALPALGWDRLQGAAHLSLPSAGAAAAVLAAAPLLQAGLFEPDTLTLFVGGEESARVEELAAAVADEVAQGITALGLASPRIIGSVVRGPLGSCVLALVTGLLTNADAADPAVLQKALREFPADPALRICKQGEQPDTGRIAGTPVAELSAAPAMLAERVTAACALDGAAFLAQAVRVALQAG